MSVNEKMTAIADAIRAKTGGTGPLTLDGMAEAISSIQTGNSGGGIQFSTGTFTPSEDSTSCTISHGLGVRPDIVVYWAEEATKIAMTMIFGANAIEGVMDVSGSNGPVPAASAAQYTTNEIGAYFWGPKTTSSGQKSYLDQGSSKETYRPYCAPNTANNETFKIGCGKDYYARAGMSYRWIAIAGVKQ